MTDGADVVDPADRRVHDILVRIIETTTDDAQRETARELLLTLPPMREWPEDTLRAMYEVLAFVEIRKSFRRSLRRV
jgi:hypothetical protein